MRFAVIFITAHFSFALSSDLKDGLTLTPMLLAANFANTK